MGRCRFATKRFTPNATGCRSGGRTFFLKYRPDIDYSSGGVRQSVGQGGMLVCRFISSNVKKGLSDRKTLILGDSGQFFLYGQTDDVFYL